MTIAHVVALPHNTAQPYEQRLHSPVSKSCTALRRNASRSSETSVDRFELEGSEVALLLAIAYLGEAGEEAGVGGDERHELVGGRMGRDVREILHRKGLFGFECHGCLVLISDTKLVIFYEIGKCLAKSFVRNAYYCILAYYSARSEEK